MARSNKRLTKPSVSSKKSRAPHAKLGHGQANKNVNTLRKLEQVSHSEKIAELCSCGEPEFGLNVHCPIHGAVYIHHSDKIV